MESKGIVLASEYGEKRVPKIMKESGARLYPYVYQYQETLVAPDLYS